MDFIEITQLIGSYGFPIICCLYMVHERGKSDSQNREQLAQMQDVIQANTTATNNLVTLLTNMIHLNSGGVSHE